MKNITRREFIKTSAVTVAVTSTCLCGLTGCATITKIGDTPSVAPESFILRADTLTVDLSKEPILSKVGGAVKIRDAAIPDGIILAHVEEQRFEIASLLCPHRGVEVEYDHKNRQFECASLGSSTFTLDGANISGPAGKPLKAYEAFLKDSVLTIKI